MGFPNTTAGAKDQLEANAALHFNGENIRRERALERQRYDEAVRRAHLEAYADIRAEVRRLALANDRLMAEIMKK